MAFKLNFQELNCKKDLGLGGYHAIGGATFTFTAGASNIAEVAIQLTRADGTAIAEPMLFTWWLSDVTTGIGYWTGTSASGTVQAKSAKGVDFHVLVAKKCTTSQTLATGIYTLEITDTNKGLFYVCVANPLTGKAIVSRVMTAADYG